MQKNQTLKEVVFSLLFCTAHHKNRMNSLGECDIFKNSFITAHAHVWTDLSLGTQKSILEITTSHIILFTLEKLTRQNSWSFGASY